MIDTVVNELTRLGVSVIVQPETMPSHVAEYITSETNALYVRYGNSHQIYFFRDIDLNILVHEAIHFLQNRLESSLVFCSEEELLLGFPQYWEAVGRAYRRATRKELLQETEAHVFQQYPELVLKELQNVTV